MTVFKYQKQVIIDMTVFHGGPRCHIDTCFWHPNKNVVFGMQNQVIFQYDAFEGGSWCQTTILIGRQNVKNLK
jgi:hypothetical protein